MSDIPRYQEFTGWLQRLPDAWLMGMLWRIVLLCESKGVFSEGELQATVNRAREAGRHHAERACP